VVIVVAAAGASFAGLPRPHNGSGRWVGRGASHPMDMTLALMSKNVKITWQADGNKRRQCMANDEIYFAAGGTCPLKPIDGMAE